MFEMRNVRFRTFEICEMRRVRFRTCECTIQIVPAPEHFARTVHARDRINRAAPPAGTGRRPESEPLSTRRSSRCRRYQRPHSNLAILSALAAQERKQAAVNFQKVVSADVYTYL